MTRACDLIVSGGLFFLLLFTPFAFGAVHPWAYMTMESAIFLLVAVALAKLIYSRCWPNPLGHRTAGLVLPLGAFLTLVSFQIVPLPPALLEFLSPETYRLYQTSLPGWPHRSAYIDLLRSMPSQPAQPRLLPTTGQPSQAEGPRSMDHRNGVSELKNSANPIVKGNRVFPWSWRPLSIAPSLTFTDLNKFLAYSGLFFIVLLYPFGTLARADSRGKNQTLDVRPEWVFLRSLVLILLACASLVALVGIVQLFAGNGKILWLFVPYDWDGPVGIRQRASGPFVNPDHFANYLAMIFPFAVALAAKPRIWFAPASAHTTRFYCAIGATIMFMAILLSLSRFGWLSALLGIVLLFFTWRSGEPSRRMIFSRWRTLIRSGYAAAAVLAVLTLTFWLVGPQARHAIDTRLADAIAGDGTLSTRLSVWRDMLPMVRDFALLGTGLGTWSDLFPRYQSTVGGEVFFREAHNDFLELLAETGVIGFALLALFFFQAGRLILAGLKAATENLRVILAPSVAALSIMLVHELFDFSLQIPANAWLFTLLLGVSTRLAVKALAQQPTGDHQINTWLPLSGIALAALLCGLTFTQDWLPYPYNLPAPATLAEAAERINRHPAQAAGHAMIAMLMADRAPLQQQIDEYAIAMRLQPNDPRLRDLYAGALLRAGLREQGLNEVRRSVSLAPTLERHFYLDEKLLPFLADDERQAIEGGFEQAIARGDMSAMDQLARFYERIGQSRALAKLFESRAARSTDAGEKSEFLLKAGQRYVAVGEPNKAKELFNTAIATRPQDPRPYQNLALSVYGPQGNTEQTSATIEQGIANRADAVSLYLTLAEAMKTIGSTEKVSGALDHAEKRISQAATRGDDVLARYLTLADTARRVALPDREQTALEKALELRPNDKDLLYRLGQLYLNAGRDDRAVQVFTRLSEVTPRWAPAFLQLALAEERRFGFAQADRAYARAAELEPGNPDYARYYDSFKARLAQTGASAPR